MRRCSIAPVPSGRRRRRGLTYDGVVRTVPSSVLAICGLGLALGGLLGACPGSAFSCTDDAQCARGEGDAWCEPGGHCSFPADDCPSGRRYGEHSPAGLAGQCVEPTAASSTGPTTGEASGSDDDTVDSTGPLMPTTGSPGDLVFTDDEWNGEFAAGTIDGLEWDGSAVRLARGAFEGTLVSRPFDAEGPASWTTLSWWGSAPHGKPLPDGGAAESGYTEGGMDMQGNLLLLHLDLEEGPLDDGTIMLDSSGTGHDAVLLGDGAIGGPGIFGRGLQDAASSRLLVDPTDFVPVEDDFSWAVWVRLDGGCAGAPAMFGMDSASSPESANIWLACLEAGSFPSCPGGDGGLAAFVVSATQQPGGGGVVCGPTRIDDGQWHHVVATKQGHAPATLRTYVDGQIDAEGTATIDGPLVFPDDVELSIGAHPGDTFQLTGGLDEVAIWSRALSEDEVVGMYRRGMLRLELGVRTCDDPQCDTAAPFTGPNGSGDPFVELADGLGPGVARTLGLEGPVLQYRARLESRLPGLSPGLERVTVTADLP